MGVIAMARDNYFILGGIDSRNYDMVVSCEDAFVMPKRDVDAFEVPGRNGELIVDNGRFQNVEITYQVIIESGFAEKINGFKKAVGKLRGYVRLEDTFDIDVYRMASVQDIKISELGMRYNGGVFEIRVNCKPQKFLRVGEAPIQFILSSINDKADAPQMLSDSNFFTRYFPVSPTHKTVTFELHDSNPTSGRAHLQVSGVVDADPATASEVVYDEDFADGDVVSVTIPNTYAYYNIMISRENVQRITDVWARVKGWSRYNGIDIEFNALMARALEIENPTGFYARPTLETYLFPALDFKITNYANDEADEYFIWRSISDTAERHVFLDCDMQYIYDGSGNNMSQYLYISTAQNAKGKSLVFPGLGPEKIVFSVNYRETSMTAAADYAPSLLFLYPRWWTV